MTAVTAPQYQRLKDLHLLTRLVAQGRAAAAIVAPRDAAHLEAARLIQAAIEHASGVRVPVFDDSASEVAVPSNRNLILIGNRSTNNAINFLYDRHFTLLDLRYPGRGGYDVRSLHNPFGNGANVIMVGGSDAPGVQRGAAALAETVSAGKAESGELSVGWLMNIELGEEVTVPTDLQQCENWDASKGYGSKYFGWNSISTRMALYYMTGDPFHAREVLRLSFPDARAIEELEEADDERIENKRDPLAGPYHYNAHNLILYWDLIEESPEFSDEQRLAITNALARQIGHGRGIERILELNSAPEKVGSRHEAWAAVTVYCLARYFQRDYPNEVWKRAMKSAQWFFEPLQQPSPWVVGESQDLYWYGTGIAPILSFLVLTGQREPVENGALGEILRGQEMLISGPQPDWALNFASLDFLHKAAYLTGDGRWLHYRERTGVDTGIFRLGQSFWPDGSLESAAPVNLIGKWDIQSLHPLKWGERHSRVPLAESFEFASYRSAADGSGNFLLLKGMNGGRAGYHSLAVWELRLAGRTLLKGADNQLFVRADGMVPSRVSEDAALKQIDALGQAAWVVAEVAEAGCARWRRSMVVRETYALFVDEVSANTNDTIVEVLLQWGFDTPELAAAATPAISEPVQVRVEQAKVTASWEGPLPAGRCKRFFSVLGADGPAQCHHIADGAAAMRLRDASLAVVGSYDGTRAELAILESTALFGVSVHAVSAGVDVLRTTAPVDVDWDLIQGTLHLRSASSVVLTIPLDDEDLSIDGKPVQATSSTGAMLQITVSAGSHRIERARLKSDVMRALYAYLSALTNDHPQQVASKKDVNTTSRASLSRTPMTRVKLGADLKEMIKIPSANGELIAAAAGDCVHLLRTDGTIVRTFRADALIQKLHWWPQHQLLIAGCADEKVIAFDEQGRRRWVFVSETDPALLTWGKTYWYKTSPGQNGIHGLDSGVFFDGESQLFVGSACTLELLNSAGTLVRRLPVFWGLPSVFCIVPGPNQSLDLLVGRKHNGFNRVPVINNRTLDATPRGFHDVPAGATYIDGWCSINRNYIFYEDLAGDGHKLVISDANGIWNRVQVWELSGGDNLRRFPNEMEAGVCDRDCAGRPLYDACFGPGPSYRAGKGNFSRKNVRDLKISDVDEDGAKEVIVALWTGWVIALDQCLRRKWTVRLPAPPTVMEIVSGGIIVACENGALLLLDGSGSVIGGGQTNEMPVAIIASADRADEGVVLVGTAAGAMEGFSLSRLAR